MAQVSIRTHPVSTVGELKEFLEDLDDEMELDDINTADIFQEAEIVGDRFMPLKNGLQTLTLSE